MIVDCAVYEHGVRREGELDVSDALEAVDQPGAFVWIGIHHPEGHEFDEVAAELELHQLAIEDAVNAHQRPKLELYHNTVFVVLQTAEQAGSKVKLAELQLFVGERFVVSVRHGEASALSRVRKELESDPERFAFGPTAVLHAVCDRVVDDYGPIADAIGSEIDEIEDEVFSDDRTNSAERIYFLKRQLANLHRAMVPLKEVLEQLVGGALPDCPVKMMEYFRDVEDHLLREIASAEMYRDLLADALDANLARLNLRQNDDMRTISAWAAVIAVPTMLAGLWGMNFTEMPELRWAFGYPLALSVLVGSALAVYFTMRRAGWLGPGKTQDTQPGG